MATNFQFSMGKKSKFWREHRPDQQRIRFKAQTYWFQGLSNEKGFSGPLMQFKAFFRQPPKFKAFSRLCMNLVDRKQNNSN